MRVPGAISDTLLMPVDLLRLTNCKNVRLRRPGARLDQSFKGFNRFQASVFFSLDDLEMALLDVLGIVRKHLLVIDQVLLLCL